MMHTRRRHTTATPRTVVFAPVALPCPAQLLVVEALLLAVLTKKG